MRSLSSVWGRVLQHAWGAPKCTWGVQFHVFRACHALHAQKLRGVIGACFKKSQYLILKCALGASGQRMISAQFPATCFIEFSRRGVLLLYPAGRM